MATTKWVLDTAHSEIQFKVRHMMIANVTGKFHKFDASAETEGDDFTTAKISFTADIDSVNTGSEQRDAHLKSEDFFDAANHPQMKFEGTSLEKIDDEHYKLNGNLTIRSTTKPVTLNVEYGGMQQDPWGNTRVGFSIDGKLNRKEYGLHWHAVTEAGGIVAGDEVKLHAEAQFIKQ
jgi:polyisoprenoid-binding protein YceI